MGSKISAEQFRDMNRRLALIWRAPGWHSGGRIRWAAWMLRRAGLIEPAPPREKSLRIGEVWIMPTADGLSWPDCRQYAADRVTAMPPTPSLLYALRETGVRDVVVWRPQDWRLHIGALQLAADVAGARWVQHDVTRVRVTRGIERGSGITAQDLARAWLAGERVDIDAMHEAARATRQDADPPRGVAPSPAPAPDWHADVDDYAVRLHARLSPYSGPWHRWVDTLGPMSGHARRRLEGALRQLALAGAIRASIAETAGGMATVHIWHVRR